MTVLFIIIEIFYLIVLSFKTFNKLYNRRIDIGEKILDIIIIFLAGVLAVFGARGGFSQSTLNWGRAYSVIILLPIRQH